MKRANKNVRYNLRSMSRYAAGILSQFFKKEDRVRLAKALGIEERTLNVKISQARMTFSEFLLLVMENGYFVEIKRQEHGQELLFCEENNMDIEKLPIPLIYFIPLRDYDPKTDYDFEFGEDFWKHDDWRFSSGSYDLFIGYLRCCHPNYETREPIFVKNGAGKIIGANFLVLMSEAEHRQLQYFLNEYLADFTVSEWPKGKE